MKYVFLVLTGCGPIAKAIWNVLVAIRAFETLPFERVFALPVDKSSAEAAGNKVCLYCIG